MFKRAGVLRSSPTDLANFLACRHKTTLDLLTADGKLAPPTWTDPLAAVLRERGQEHENAYVATLSAEGLRVKDLTRPDGASRKDDGVAVGETLAAIREGWDVIVQAALGDGGTFGYADVLRRVPGESALGDWHYEVHDTKLATETKGGTILQLCAYTDLIEALQGRRPEHFVVVTPEATHRYRFEDFAAFYRLVSEQYRAFLASPSDVYPNPTEHCEVCRWWDRCNGRRRADDHLTFVAGLGRTQQAELETRDVPTLETLADVPLPLPFRPKRGARETYERLREQARVQRQQRNEHRPVHELLPVESERGFCRLPEPSKGDLFLDLEGDPYVQPSGREYLFGLGRVDADAQFTYRAWWAMTEAEERAAFDEVIAEMMAALTGDPAAHIYHYAPYEPSAMKRLMGQYVIRENDVDSLLRGGRFVDLYAVVRESLRAGVESYSIKKMEPFYHFTREVELPRAGDERRVVELALETGDTRVITESVRATVEGYNRDDVRSTADLRTWLETLRHGLVANGVEVPRFVSEGGEASEDVSERTRRIETLRARLLAMMPGLQPAGAEAVRLLAFLIDFHYREDKVVWWEYFRLLGMPDEDLLDEGAAVAALEFAGKVGDVMSKKGKPTGSAIHRYRYPQQEMEIRADAELHGRDGEKFGESVAVDRAARTIDVKRGKKGLTAPHPTSLFTHERVSPEIPAGSLFRMAEHVAERGLDLAGPYGAGLSLLCGAAPHVGGRALVDVDRHAGESMPAFAARIAGELTKTVLPIQGAPGAGKTFAGAEMICELVRQSKRVGVTATGHKVIRNLLNAVADAAKAKKQPIRLGHKPKEVSDDASGPIREFDDNNAPLAALAASDIDVLGGTAWLWSRPEFAQSVDVLFVDEAGQMSLAAVLAVSQAADSLVLLGDPQQLEQPQKGSHPDGVDVSALQHVLGDQQTMPAERGLFLSETWRLAPAICAFTSEVFYERRLRSREGLDVQRVSGSARFSGAGLRVLEVLHEGCRNASDEEVDVVAAIVDELLEPDVRWTALEKEEPVTRPLTARDILVVAPHNAHVGRLSERLESRGVTVGTVDKFQGQEAPVVIYSMATSRPEDAPRGMEFLYSLNRLNVATSRAKGICILVASPRLFEPECRTPRQMHLANALCRYREMAEMS
jgi:predicted RecB family nuclease